MVIAIQDQPMWSKSILKVFTAPHFLSDSTSSSSSIYYIHFIFSASEGENELSTHVTSIVTRVLDNRNKLSNIMYTLWYAVFCPKHCDLSYMRYFNNYSVIICWKRLFPRFSIHPHIYVICGSLMKFKSDTVCLHPNNTLSYWKIFIRAYMYIQCVYICLCILYKHRAWTWSSHAQSVHMDID